MTLSRECGWEWLTERDRQKDRQTDRQTDRQKLSEESDCSVNCLHDSRWKHVSWFLVQQKYYWLLTEGLNKRNNDSALCLSLCTWLSHLLRVSVIWVIYSFHEDTEAGQQNMSSDLQFCSAWVSRDKQLFAVLAPELVWSGFFSGATD